MLAMKQRRAPATAPGWSDTHVLAAVDGERYLLADGRSARCAVSCLVMPEAGDRVLVGTAGSDCFVLHVLEREADGRARVRVPGAREFCLEQESVAVLARRKLALLSLGDVDLSAAQGSLLLNARNLFVTAADSVVENARYRVTQVHHYLMQVKELWRVQSRQGLVTAEQDLKIDAERVSVG